MLGLSRTDSVSVIVQHGNVCMKRSDDAVVAVMRSAGFEPLVPYPGVDSPWLSRCGRCSRQVQPTLSNVRAGKRCRYCSGNAVVPSEAVAVMRSAGFEPLAPYPGANKPWRCRCRVCGFEPAPTLNTARNGHGCRNCAGQVLDPADAVRVMRVAGLEPKVPYPGADTPWLCHCATCGNDPRPTLSSIRRGRGCAFCGQMKTRQARLMPEADAIGLMRVAGLEPLTPYPGANRAWECRCMTCDRLVSPSLSTVRSGTGTGCSYCARKTVDPSEADRIMRAAQLDPQVPYPGADKPWLCVCTRCGRLITPRLNNIRKAQGCRYCSRRAVDPLEAEQLMLNAGFEPLTPYPGAGRRWRCRCVRCGKMVTPLMINVRKGVGCKHCASFGFDYSAPAVVYVMCHPFGSVKVGIAGASKRNTRIADHRRYGWKLFRQLHLPSGDQAWQVEQAVLTLLRGEFALDAFMSADIMPKGGWTETFDAEIVSPDALWNMVQNAANRKRWIPS